MKKIITIFSVLSLLLSGCGSYITSQVGNFDNWISYRYYEDNSLAYFADRDFSIDTFSLYNLVWNIKTAETINLILDDNRIKQDLSFMENKFYYQSDIDHYGEEYVVYLCSELYRYNRDIFSSIETYLNLLSEQKNKLIQNPNDEDFTAKATLLTKATVNFGLMLDDSDEESIILVASSFDESASTFLELVESLDAIEIALLSNRIEREWIYNKYNSIQNNLRELMKDVESSDIPFLSTIILKMLQIENDLKLSATINSDIVSNIYNLKEYYAGLDIQTKYEVYTILSYHNISIEDPAIKSFFEYKIYMCPFWQNVRSLYYGILLSDIHLFSYNSERILAYLKTFKPQSFRSISDLYYYYMVHEKLNEEIEMDIIPVYQSLADSYQQNRLSFEELYYFYVLSDVLNQDYEYISIKDIEISRLGKLDDVYYCLLLFKITDMEFEPHIFVDVCAELYDMAEGGYYFSADYKQPSVSSTYYALQIYKELNLSNNNISSIKEFIDRMQLDDGGIAEIREHTSGTLETFYKASWIMSKSA